MKAKNYFLIAPIVTILSILVCFIFIQPLSLMAQGLPPGTPIHTDNGGCNLQVNPIPPTQGNQVVLLVKEITGYPMNLNVTDVDNHITNPQNLHVVGGSYWCNIYGYLNPFHNINVKVDPVLLGDPNRDSSTIHANAYQLNIFDQNKRLPDNTGNNVYLTSFPNVNNDRNYFIDISITPNTQVNIQESFKGILKNYTINNKLLLWQFVPKSSALNSYSLTINSTDPSVVINVYFMQ